MLLNFVLIETLTPSLLPFLRLLRPSFLPSDPVFRSLSQSTLLDFNDRVDAIRQGSMAVDAVDVWNPRASSSLGVPRNAGLDYVLAVANDSVMRRAWRSRYDRNDGNEQRRECMTLYKDGDEIVVQKYARTMDDNMHLAVRLILRHVARMRDWKYMFLV